MSNKEQVRVLIFTESFYPYTSGIARRFIEIIRRLALDNFKIHILTGTNNPDGWIDDERTRSNVSFGILKAIEFESKIDCNLPFLYPQFGILNEILKFKPNVVHVVEHTPAAMLCGLMAKALNIPLICSSHTHIDSYIPLYIYPRAVAYVSKGYRHVRRTFLNVANCNLTVSMSFAKILAKSGVTTGIQVWKTGVDSQLFHAHFKSHEMRLRMFNGYYSPDKILLLSVGRLSPEKHFEYLLNIIQKFPKTFLCVVGDGAYKSSLQPLFPRDRAHFIGFLQGKELASAYASADLFVYASTSETFGQVFLEAMSCALPIVAAEGPQMQEFFINNLHGFTWQPNNLQSTFEAIKMGIQERDRLAQKCRSNAKNHSWDSSATQIAQLYREHALYNQKTNLLSLIFHFSMYTSLWLYIILVLLTLAPFVKVINPLKNIEESQKKEPKKFDLSALSALFISLILTLILILNGANLNTSLYTYLSI